MKPVIHALVVYFCLGGICSAELNRGVWFWGSTTTPGGPSPYGSSVVVGDATAEDETVAFFSSHGVKQVYGSYQNRPVTESGVIGDWNLKLEYAGIDSQLLLDGTQVNDPVWVAGLLNKVQERLIDFNNGYLDLIGYKFDALHLDLEPQGLPEWDTPASKRALLDDLADVYAQIRALMDAEGLAGVPIYADIHFAWDKLPVDGGSVGWVDAADRDGWYADLGDSLAGVTVMTFSKDTVAELEVATLFERTGTFPGFARIGIQPKGWPGEMWPSILHVNAVLNDLEDVHAPDYATDLENYAFWRYSIEETGPVVGPAVEVDIELSDDDGVIFIGGTGVGPVIVFPGVAGYTYSVKQGEPGGRQWAEVERVRVKDESGFEVLRVPVQPSGKRSFWRVGVSKDLPDQ